MRGELVETGLDLDLVRAFICFRLEADEVCLMGKVGDGEEEEVDERGDEGDEEDGDTDAEDALEEGEPEDWEEDTITKSLFPFVSKLLQPSNQ